VRNPQQCAFAILSTRRAASSPEFAEALLKLTELLRIPVPQGVDHKIVLDVRIAGFANACLL